MQKLATIQLLPKPLLRVYKKYVALMLHIHKDNRLVCLVGSGEADLLTEAALVDYKLQLHNNPFRRSRIKKASELCDPKEKLHHQ